MEKILIDKTDEELENLLQPHTGYSMKEIIILLSGFEFFHKLNDLEAIGYLLDKEVIKQDFERDNYYKFSSSPF